MNQNEKNQLKLYILNFDQNYEKKNYSSFLQEMKNEFLLNPLP